MSEALDRVRDLRRAGFGCLPLYDEHGQMDAVQATRVRTGHIETVLIWGEHDALAARCRDDDHAAVVWHQAGTTADVIAALLDLPAPGTRHAPALALATPTELWLPPGCGPWVRRPLASLDLTCCRHRLRGAPSEDTEC